MSMAAMDFLESLGRHFGKRHPSPEAEDLWMRDMMEVVKGTDPLVLRRAYQLIRDEHDERAFPLPASIRKYISRACESVYPERVSDADRKVYPWTNRSLRAPDSPEEIERCRLAREWQHRMIAQYGSWAAWWRANEQFCVASTKAKPEPVGGPAEPQRDTSRPAFEKMQRDSRTGLHIDLMKRITGDRS